MSKPENIMLLEKLQTQKHKMSAENIKTIQMENRMMVTRVWKWEKSGKY